ncbi:oligopeptide/dipeptide ABC transporter ATP-binding protein [Actinomadura algeriensis]|uniref:Oligopeptide/dipeptide ABC transporter ATP-binding protein n=1 Tax=Actinomadura algeriensis TaxID=1679523 RepID=A0ABR9K1M8_9ACTN|nr:ABC transporter ATP-binding protein [Actinomadura algeriensis]MBE1536623.1 oligopeptide/dipeptide ABC transporter ATP-binding protein [Actinomadura algeriensis]
MKDTGERLLDVRDLTVGYEAGRAMQWRKEAVNAVDSVSFDLRPGETLGLVGESGSGKSTIGRALLRLVDVTGGTIDFDGLDVTALGRRTPLTYRRAVQAVFQDPMSSLNPRHAVSQAVTVPLRRHGIGDRAARDAAAAEAFERVGLSRAHLGRRPAELSGGQRQRVAIARALALEPRLVVCDEAVSALDVSTQSQIINLLADLRESTGMSYLFIAHDLRVVRHISHRIAVLHAGRLVEFAPVRTLFDAPKHPYTRALLAASPSPHPDGRERRRSRRENYEPNRSGEPIVRGAAGCPFRGRCARVMDVCHTTTPVLRERADGSRVACHLYEGDGGEGADGAKGAPVHLGQKIHKGRSSSPA